MARPAGGTPWHACRSGWTPVRFAWPTIGTSGYLPAVLGRARHSPVIANAGVLEDELPGRAHLPEQPAGDLLQRLGGRRIRSLRRSPGTGGDRSRRRRRVLHARSDQRAASHDYASRRGVPAVPCEPSHARRARARRALGRTRSHRHAGLTCLVVFHRSSQPARTTLGRMVRHRNARGRPSHGQPDGGRRGGHDRPGRRRQRDRA